MRTLSATAILLSLVGLACVSNAQTCGAWKPQHGLNAGAPWGSFPFGGMVGTRLDESEYLIVSTLGSSTMPNGSAIPTGRSNQIFYYDASGWHTIPDDTFGTDRFGNEVASWSTFVQTADGFFAMGGNISIEAAWTFAHYTFSTDTWVELPVPAGIVGPGTPEGKRVAAVFEGELYVAVDGLRTNAEGNGSHLWRWNGATWTPVATFVGAAPTRPVAELCVTASRLVLGGNFDGVSIFGGPVVAAKNIVSLQFLGNTLVASPLGSGLSSGACEAGGVADDGVVFAVRPKGNGVLAGGKFNRSGSSSLSTLATWDFSASSPAWTSFGSSTRVVVDAIAANNGVYVVTGNITSGEVLCYTAGIPHVRYITATSDTAISDPDWSSQYSRFSLETQLFDWNGPCGIYEVVCLPGFGSQALNTAGYSRWGIGSPALLDVNNDCAYPSQFDDLEAADLVATGGACASPFGCNSWDFNNNGVFPEDADLLFYFAVAAGATCE